MTVLGKSQVEVVDEASQNYAHLNIGQAERLRFVRGHIVHRIDQGEGATWVKYVLASDAISWADTGGTLCQYLTEALYERA